MLSNFIRSLISKLSKTFTSFLEVSFITCSGSSSVFSVSDNQSFISVTKSAVQRYASNLMESLNTLRMTWENFRAVMKET